MTFGKGRRKGRIKRNEIIVATFNPDSANC